MARITLRECRLLDLEGIRHLQPEGWSDITPHYHFYCTQAFCYPIVAIEKDRIAGAATGILNGESGWLAHIVVAPEYRFYATAWFTKMIRRKSRDSFSLISGKG